MESRLHVCSFDGCGKSFSRKEHLSRHEKTHDPENLLTCKVCGREFNRNDSLQRHLARHGDVFKPTPSGRSKRACISCRAGKIKCDGNDRCATCVKRGVECKYRQEDQPVTTESQRQTESPNPAPSEVMEVDQLSLTSGPVIAPESTSVSRNTVVTPSNPLSEESAQGRKVSEAFKLPGPTGLVDWSAVKILRDTTPRDTKVPHDPASAQYLEIYFTSFHHRWTIVHRPSFEAEHENTFLVSSAKMIGAWLLGSSESKPFAITWHDALVEQLLPRLCKVTSQDRLHQSLSLAFCQSALLNIIFALYYGNDGAISRAAMLRNVLVGALREVGFFKSETAWIDEKPGFFVPMRLVRLGSRQRLASYLFKIDAYLSVLRDQPAIILPEELHFSLPSAFGLYNADGLHLWEERQASEPIYRGQKSIAKMITEGGLESVPGNDTPLLIEDIQTCICAMQSTIWKSCASNECQVGAVLQKDSLRRQLDNLKTQLDKMFSQFSENAEFGQEKYLPLRYYYGYEDHSQPGWQNIVVSRVKGLHFDTVMLYHLFSLELFAEVRTLTNLAKDRRLGTVEEASTVHRQAREQRLAATKLWGATPAARWSLCHAVDVLVAHQNIGHHDSSCLGLTIRTLDPIARIAVCVSALVVWAYCTLDIQGCEVCTPGGATVIELTRWSASGPQYEKEKESWIEEGKGCRVQLQGIQLCSCNVDYLMALFQAYLPEAWSDAIAPGVFKTLI